jgi:hypothetical protein
MVGVPLQTKDLVNSLGSSAEVISAQVGSLQDGSLEKLKKLRSAYTVPTASLTKYQAAADRASDMPPFGFNPSPGDALTNLAPAVGSTYYREEVAPHSTASDPFSALLDRHTKRAQLLAMAIQKRSDVRLGVERVAVGRVLPDGRNDGAITIETGRRAQNVSSSAMVADEIEQAARRLPPDVLKKFLEVYYSDANFGAFGVRTSGMGSFDDELGQADGFVLNQAGGVATTYTSGTGLDTSSGLDVDILKLKRAIDKKTHAMELYSQTLTAYNNIAKNIIDKARA